MNKTSQERAALGGVGRRGLRRDAGDRGAGGATLPADGGRAERAEGVCRQS